MRLEEEVYAATALIVDALVIAHAQEVQQQKRTEMHQNKFGSFRKKKKICGDRPDPEILITDGKAPRCYNITGAPDDTNNNNRGEEEEDLDPVLLLLLRRLLPGEKNVCGHYLHHHHHHPHFDYAFNHQRPLPPPEICVVQRREEEQQPQWSRGHHQAAWLVGASTFDLDGHYSDPMPPTTEEDKPLVPIQTTTTPPVSFSS